MLTTFPDHAAEPLPHTGATWIDLRDASEADIRLVEQVTGLNVPSRADLEEIETSSRTYRVDNAIYLSMPIVRPGTDNVPETTPLGFILTQDRLITIRYVALPSFDALAASLRRAGSPAPTAAAIFAALLEGIVERISDVLERVGADLDQISYGIFHAKDRKTRANRADAALRGTLRRVGQCGDLASKLRDTLLALSRIVPYVEANATTCLNADLHLRLLSVREDLHSLSDYTAHLQGKVQFMLDATLGFINMEQNDIIKVLAVVSVVGIPPTLVAGMYGMNFKGMPEYDWAWGYPYGLTVIFLSGIIPLIWIKLRGWL